MSEKIGPGPFGLDESECFACGSKEVAYVEAIGIAWCVPCMDRDDKAYSEYAAKGFPRPSRKELDEFRAEMAAFEVSSDES